MVALRSLPARRRARCARTLILFAALAAPAGADLVVTRNVRADQFARPGVGGAASPCPARIERPLSGEKVKLSVAPTRARRDEAAVSFIVDLDAGRAYIVDHRARSYSELAFPARTPELAGPMRAGLGAEGDKLFPYRRLGQVYQSVSNREGASRVTRAARVGNGFGAELEVEVELLPDAALAPAALAVETFAQAVRGSGESWLPALEPLAGVPVGLVEELQLPDSAVRYREAAAATEAAPIDPAQFAPPAGYTKVAHRPECF